MKWTKYIVLCMFAFCSLSIQAQLNTDRITAIGRNALYFDDYVLSIQYFNQVIRLKPYLYEPYQLRAIAKIQLGDLTGALGDCDQAIHLNPFQPGSYYTRGFVYRGLGKLEEAEADFTQALVFSPENKTYMLLRADVRSQQKNYTDALSDIDYMLRREPHSPTLLFERGAICLSSQDTLAAREAFEQTIRYDSQNPGNWSALGVVNLMLGHDEEALNNLSQAINLGSKHAGDYINRGIIYYRSHNYRAAISDYDKAVTLSPDEAQCFYNRGVLRHELGDYNHALEDFNRAIDLQPEQTEMYYQRATTLMQLKQWKEAVSDFETLMARYPYFLPSYYLAAQAKTAMGDSKGAYLYRQKAYDLEQHKDSIVAAQQKAVHTDVQIAQASSGNRDRRKEFSSRAAQNQTDPNELTDEKYTSETRGSIQRRHVDVASEPNIVLSYYIQQVALRQTNYYHVAVDDYNRRSHLPSPLRFTVQELPLTADMVNRHFEQISRLSNDIDRLTRNTKDLSTIAHQLAPLFFARAIEFALVQDYISAMDDATRALNNCRGNNEEEAIITFCRANWRFKQLQYQRATGELTTESAMDFDIMLRDYDYVTKLQPDFQFAYYNKANMLCSQREYDAAIEHYTMAIKADADFAEAYFNRGLTYIYTDRVEQGIADLSKAGELGIYQAYNLISRFQ